MDLSGSREHHGAATRGEEQYAVSLAHVFTRQTGSRSGAFPESNFLTTLLGTLSRGSGRDIIARWVGNSLLRSGSGDGPRCKRVFAVELGGSRASTEQQQQRAESPTDIYSAALAGLSGADADADAAAARVSSEVAAPTPHPSMSHVSRVCVSGARGPVLSNLREPLPSTRGHNSCTSGPTLSAFAPRSAAWALFSFGTRSVSRPRRPGCRDTPSGLRIHPPLFRLQQPAPTFHGHASLQPTRSLTTLLTSVGCGSGVILLVPGLLHFCSLHQLDPICRQHPPTTHQPLTKATVADAPPFRFQPLHSSAALPCPARPSHGLHAAPSPAILLEGRGGVASAAPYRGESGATLVCSNVLRRVKPRPIKA
ncbi:hypothetical protein Purlil1_133 [Purpureocillium lilacinum]|uniref:Uncharacterized protein n=1 Tax=Purpureocillium lilacinum TaxID=33203 RepID=A0ABR0CGU9_PURLI|nr:hypothetical protein Purlil1_133 [Purpureocillium lilacinum]